jgi:hypothetical protein
VDAPVFEGNGHFGAMAVIRLDLSIKDKTTPDAKSAIRGGTGKNLTKAG